jgi:hypothetical protein
MIEMPISDIDLMTAKSRSDLMGVLASSRTQGKGNLAGFVGEALTERHTSGKLVESFDYDIEIGDLKIDVKTKSCSSDPKGHYLCSVMSYQLKNECDGYIFARVNLASGVGWLLGYISKVDLLDRGFFAKKGSPDGRFTFTEDCWNVQISNLDNIPLSEQSHDSTDQ